MLGKKWFSKMTDEEFKIVKIDTDLTTGNSVIIIIEFNNVRRPQNLCATLNNFVKF